MKQKRKVISVSLNEKEYQNYKKLVESFHFDDFVFENFSESMKMKYMISYFSEKMNQSDLKK